MTASLDFSSHHQAAPAHHRAAHVASYDVVRGAQQMVELGGELTGLVQYACTKKLSEEQMLVLSDALERFNEIARDLKALAPRIARALAS